jgi:hypothetical protein
MFRTLLISSVSSLASLSLLATAFTPTSAAATDRGTAAVTLTTQVFDQHGHNVTGHQVPLLATEARASIFGAATPPTGTVTYSLYKENNNCSTRPVEVTTVHLGAGGAVPSSGLQILSALGFEKYSYRTTYSGDARHAPASAPCVWFVRDCSENYWRVHLASTAAVVEANQPFYLGAEKIGGSTSQIESEVYTVFKAKNCRNFKVFSDLVSCMAARALAVNLDVDNGSPTVISTTVTAAELFLGIGGTTHMVRYDGRSSAGVIYAGPASTPSSGPNAQSQGFSSLIVALVTSILAAVRSSFSGPTESPVTVALVEFLNRAMFQYWDTGLPPHLN